MLLGIYIVIALILFFVQLRNGLFTATWVAVL